MVLYVHTDPDTETIRLNRGQLQEDQIYNKTGSSGTKMGAIHRACD